MTKVPGHRTLTRRLKEKPVQNFGAQAEIRREERALELFDEVQINRYAFKDANGLAVRTLFVKKRGDLGVGLTLTKPVVN